MRGPPGLLRLVHERVLIADRDPLHEVLLSLQRNAILVRQLKDLVRLPLLRSLILLQRFNFGTVIEEGLEDVGLAADEVNVGRVLRLPLVEHR